MYLLAALPTLQSVTQWQEVRVYISHASLRCDLNSVTQPLTGLKIDPATSNNPPPQPSDVIAGVSSASTWSPTPARLSQGATSRS